MWCAVVPVSLLVGVVLVYAIRLIRAGIMVQRHSAQVRRDGVETTGTISARYTRPRFPGSVFYTFDHEGHTYTAEQRVSFRHMDTITIGDPVSIRYLPSRPTVARLSGKDADDSWSVRPVVMGCYLLIVPLFAIGLLLVFLLR